MGGRDDFEGREIADRGIALGDLAGCDAQHRLGIGGGAQDVLVILVSGDQGDG
ncbi:hypothetical protein D3C80_2202960 [compost metagenome]